MRTQGRNRKFRLAAVAFSLTMFCAAAHADGDGSTIKLTVASSQPTTLAWVGVVLFGASCVFALITLPVEFNASARAQELLKRHGIIRGDEQMAGVQKVLGAAAWTYVAAAVSAIGSWLFYVFVLLSQARPAAGRR